MRGGVSISFYERRKLSLALLALPCLQPRQRALYTITTAVHMQFHMFIGIIIKLPRTCMRRTRILMSTVCTRLTLILSINMRKGGRLLVLQLRTEEKVPTIIIITITMFSDLHRKSSRVARPRMRKEVKKGPQLQPED